LTGGAVGGDPVSWLRLTPRMRRRAGRADARVGSVARSNRRASTTLTGHTQAYRRLAGVRAAGYDDLPRRDGGAMAV